MDEAYYNIGYHTSTHTDDEGNTFITIETTWAGEFTKAAVVFPVDAAPAIAHAVLDVWNEHLMTEEDPTPYD